MELGRLGRRRNVDNSKIYLLKYFKVIFKAQKPQINI